ncbi:MAG: cache domain-containing protein [Oscillospiraceae bacterium]|nr:cache domain-containing protein [Oscillospiraceae bacterium]
MKKNKQKLSSSYRTALFIIILILGIIIVLNTALIRQTETQRIEAEGQMRLSSIASQVDTSLYRSECLLDSVAMQIEQIIASGDDISGQIECYFSADTIADISSRSDGSCFSAYAAYDGRLYINDFVPDDDFILDERSWYIGAKKRLGAVNVTEPYIDANTGEMCYTISKLLSDGSTVVGLDFNLSGIQQYIEEMSPADSGTSLIVNDNGMIVGHSQPEYVGRNYNETDFYYELVNKVFMLYGNSFDYTSDGVSYNVFSARTNYDWYLIVCVPRGDTDSILSGNTLYITLIMAVFAAAVAVFFIYVCRKKAAAEKALADKNEYIKALTLELKRPLSRIMNRAEILGSSDENNTEASAEIGDSVKELSRMLDDCADMSQPAVSAEKEETNRKKDKSPVNHRIRIALVTVVLLATGVFTLVLNTMAYGELSSLKMNSETELYTDQVQEWALTNKTVLDVIAESIASQPGFTDDYGGAVEYLDSVVSDHDDISVAYICNPEWEHTVIMNNGWEPDDSWHVEERQWYVDTINSGDNFNVSAPYLDEQTGLYCTTLSKIVYDSKGNFIGVLGIDYYLDKLIAILSESYTDTGYAFLTDIDGNILNHPYEEYQMKPGYSVNAADICYRTALSEIDGRYVVITDYDGQMKICLAMKEDVSGFNVFVVKDQLYILGSEIYSNIIYLCLFALCIILVNAIMHSLTRWQEKVNKELREAADKAINADKAKNNFLANMSHEIRTPINAVLGMNEMIMRESDEPQIVEYAANIQSAGRTLLSIINDILDLSKIESGKMEIVPVEYDVSSLVNDIVNMIRVRAEKKELRFIPEIDEKIPSVLFGDDVRLRQIITNILTNAVKYTPEGYVRLKMTVVQIQDGMLRLEVSVSDTGIGIKEEDMDKLFTSFQRLDQEKNRSIEGTGLGLTIVAQLLKMMGSELNVSSVYGVGSTFSFTVEQRIVNAEPMGNYEQRFKASADSISDNSSKTAPDVRILVVDDNETNLLVAKSLLKRTLAKVETASSGKACIELLKTNIYDIVFLDHMMPEMDGIETLKKIKEEQLGVGTVFVALTANAIHGAKQTYLEAGFDDYLSKPFTGHDIEKCLFGHISRDMIKISEDDGDVSDEEDTGSADVGSELDIEKALAALDGGEDAYMDAVYDFCDNNRCNDLELDYNFKDIKSYRVNLEKAAEDADAVGLTELADAASKLINAAENNDIGYISANHAGFIKLYRKAADNIERAAQEYFS